MKAIVLARRYAKALFELAEAQKSEALVARELKAISIALASDFYIRHFFFSPGKDTNKSNALRASLKDEYSVLTIRFLQLLFEKGRQHVLPEIAEAFDALLDKQQNRVRATAITLRPLAGNDIKILQEKLSKQFNASFEIDNQVDSTVLGGLVLKVGGKVFDNSVQTHLNQLEKLMLKSEQN